MGCINVNVQYLSENINVFTDKISESPTISILDTTERITIDCSILCEIINLLYLTVSTTSLSLDVLGSEESFTIKSNTLWTIHNGNKIKWDEGEGYITTIYNGSGDDTVYVSSDINEGIDRSQDIKVEVTNNDVYRIVNIEQEGLREIFEEGFTLADGGTFNVLKPKSYTEVEYIESDGTKYIDTGFTPNQDTRVIIDFEMQDRNTASGIIGCGFGYTTMFTIRVSSSSDTFISDYGSSYANTSKIKATGRFVIDKNKGNVTINDSLIFKQTSADFTATSTMLLFAMYSSSGSLYGCLGKLYSAKIYDNNVLIRDYIPVVWSNGDIGLYDKLEKTFTPLRSL